MIRINLLPEEFRIHDKVQTQIPAMKIAVGAGVFFVILTVWFYIDFLIAQGKVTKVKEQWAILQPQSASLKQLETEVETVLKPQNQFLNRYVTAAQPLTHVLSWLSESLPEKAWLTEVKLEREGEGARLFVKGLALPTKEKSSIEQIESYLHDLKKNIPDTNLNL